MQENGSKHFDGLIFDLDGTWVMRKREQNRQAGIPVVQKVWDEILSLQTITKSVTDNKPTCV